MYIVYLLYSFNFIIFLLVHFWPCLTLFNFEIINDEIIVLIHVRRLITCFLPLLTDWSLDVSIKALADVVWGYSVTEEADAN